MATRSLPNVRPVTSWCLQFSNQLFIKGSMEINVGALSDDGDSSVKNDSLLRVGTDTMISVSGDPKGIPWGYLMVDNAEGDDLIIVLPEELLCSILSLLTARDATRVLSTGWRYLCASPSNLHLDLYTVFGIDPSYEYWVSYSLGKESSLHIDRWINFAVETQIEKLELNFSFIPRGSQHYNFPCHLLFQDKGSKLKHLHLHYCVFRPLPDLKNCLSSLKTLDLNNAPLDQSDFDNLGSGCINLEWLRFQGCSLPRTLNIGGQYVCLKWLGFYFSDGAYKIKLSYLNLTSFEYIGEIMYLSIVGIPSLERVHLYFRHAFVIGSNYMFDGLAKDVPQLQILSPARVLSWGRLIPSSISCNIFFIVAMKFLFLIKEKKDVDRDVEPVLDLQSTSWDGEKVKREYPKDKKYYQLKEVEISGFREESNSMDFAIHLLESAVVLERMIVNSQRRFYCGGGEWNYFKFLMIEESERKYVHRLLSLVKDKQQWYEKGAALAEIDNSRKKLLTKLKEYKGEDLEVIHEATAFASETVDDNNNDLLLPPYPSRPSHSLPFDNGYISHFASNHKLAQNGLTNRDSRNERNQVGPGSRISLKQWARHFINVVANTVVTIVGVIFVLSMASFEPRLRKRDVQLKVLGLQRGVKRAE
ncbi:hypothetical protein LguiB_026545 [Lonicera macranthoides]